MMQDNNRDIKIITIALVLTSLFWLLTGGYKVNAMTASEYIDSNDFNKIYYSENTHNGVDSNRQIADGYNTVFMNYVGRYEDGTGVAFHVPILEKYEHADEEGILVSGTRHLDTRNIEVMEFIDGPEWYTSPEGPLFIGADGAEYLRAGWHVKEVGEDVSNFKALAFAFSGVAVAVFFFGTFKRFKR